MRMLGNPPFFLPERPRSSRPAVVKQATLQRSDLKSKNIGLPVELRMPSFKMNGPQTCWNFTSAICIVFTLL